MVGLWKLPSLLSVIVTLFITQRSHCWTSYRINGARRFTTALQTASQDDVSTRGRIQQKRIFPHSNPPYLSVVTDLSSCDSDELMKAALEVLHSAVSTDQVDLVSVRVNVLSAARDQERRVVEFTRTLVQWSNEHSFRVVVSSDWVNAALKAAAHGVHVKEMHRHRIPEIRALFGATSPLIGTSAHSVESAVSAVERHHPDYIFVGTCYPTQSHPEKTAMEGPQLPGQICQALKELTGYRRPKVLAIGGIDQSNCREPVVVFGAQGVAVIRAVVEADDPGAAVRSIRMAISA